MWKLQIWKVDYRLMFQNFFCSSVGEHVGLFKFSLFPNSAKPWIYLKMENYVETHSATSINDKTSWYFESWTFLIGIGGHLSASILIWSISEPQAW